MQPADTDANPACPKCGRPDCPTYPGFLAAYTDLYKHFGPADAGAIAKSTYRAIAANVSPEPARDATD